MSVPTAVPTASVAISERCTETTPGVGITGTERGTVLLGPRGVTLQSTTGDFCEWHPRAEGEAPFEEGDLVGFNNKAMLTRNTTGASSMIGIITARGIVEGSLPPAAERHKFHRVAYTGRVPVKLIGTWAVNDVVVPSGFNDGTAIAKPIHCNAVSKYAGRVIGETAEDIEGSAGGENNLNYQLVECIVTNPSQSNVLSNNTGHSTTEPARAALANEQGGVGGVGGVSTPSGHNTCEHLMLSYQWKSQPQVIVAARKLRERGLPCWCVAANPPPTASTRLTAADSETTIIELLYASWLSHADNQEPQTR